MYFYYSKASVLLTLKSVQKESSPKIMHSMQSEISTQTHQLHSLQSENEKLLAQINAAKAYLELKNELYV